MALQNNKESLSTMYQKKTDIEHILDAHDTYIGSIVQDKQCGWFINDERDKIVMKELDIVPGLYKCFD